jgi:hypothetical protein
VGASSHGPLGSLSASALLSPTIARKAASWPRLRVRARRPDRKVESKASGPVSDEIVPEGYINGGPKAGAQIDDVVLKETFGDRKAVERLVENFDAVSDDIEFQRLKAEAIGKAGLLIVDQAEQRIAR